jgi:hypothetical protein
MKRPQHLFHRLVAGLRPPHLHAGTEAFLQRVLYHIERKALTRHDIDVISRPDGNSTWAAAISIIANHEGWQQPLGRSNPRSGPGCLVSIEMYGGTEL